MGVDYLRKVTAVMLLRFRFGCIKTDIFLHKCYIFAPYNSTLPDKWEHHPDTLEISKIQEQHKELNPEEIDQSEFTSSAGEDSDADIESNEVERDTDTRRRRRRKAKEDGETERLVATSNKFALLTAE